MNIQVTARHFNGSPELHENIKSEITSLRRFNDTISDVHVILDAEKKNLRKAEILVKIQDRKLVVHSDAENMHKAVETALIKLERQLKKENKKLKEHRQQKITELVS